MSRRPVRSLATAATAGLMVLALAACNDDDTSSSGGPSSSAPASSESSESSESSSASTSTSDADGSSTPSEPAADVTVLDAGAAPQQQLLLDVEEGHVEDTTLDLTIGTSVPGSGSIEIPMTMTMETTVDDVSDDQISMSFEYQDISADAPDELGPDAQAQLDDALDAVQGISGSMTVTPSGGVLSTELAVPDDAPPTVASMLDQLTSQSAQVAVPFPSEPVGEGARWQVETTLDVGTLTTRQQATYTLDSVSEDSYSISVRVEQDIDGSASGADVHGHTTLEGSYDGTLHSFAATSGSMSGDGTSTVQLGGQKVRTTTSVEMEISTEVR